MNKEIQTLETISEQLRRELPGLRGYSSTALRNMRKFYENWDMLDSNSASALAEIDIYNTLQVPLTKDNTLPFLTFSKSATPQRILANSENQALINEIMEMVK